MPHSGARALCWATVGEILSRTLGAPPPLYRDRSCCCCSNARLSRGRNTQGSARIYKASRQSHICRERGDSVQSDCAQLCQPPLARISAALFLCRQQQGEKPRCEDVRNESAPDPHARSGMAPVEHDHVRLPECVSLAQTDAGSQG
jgi:hypothetical protein